ncbi:hypothetical protein SASPL_109279 [Salvia splendens]|uniref:ABC transporter domain-containing protein n=1 Tax=Salvia splendens TaxID=180675 RepID=A0A8X9A6Y8_SALSN|nr:hypothetical protein SASPL_109279 [Salvia splendens]
MGSIARNMTVANSYGTCSLVTVFILGGFIVSRDKINKWWIWGYWSSPMMYGQNAIAVNEFLGKSWSHISSSSGEALGARGLFPEAYWYWIGVGALVGYVFVFNFLDTMALMYLNPFGKPQPVLSEQTLAERNAKVAWNKHDQPSSAGNSHSDQNSVPVEDGSNGNGDEANSGRKRGMVLPFQPHSITFEDICYLVDMPQLMALKRINWSFSKGINGAFRLGVLTALMGITGAGKTTLLDVLLGRKTTGYISGTITISGYPKKQQTFARISGYCEQTDIHSPHLTIYQSLLYSAWLRLPPEVQSATRKMFIEEVMELVEVTEIRGGIVGLHGLNGLSPEQRKRLTVAVELVANPSIIFMDEPTSGLDARAAAIVMRAVRNTVDTGRTVVCTIHQPSIDLFDSFDEGIDGVAKIKDGYNPATWMLEVTSIAQEAALGVDFAQLYKNSELYRRNKALIEELNKPVPDSKDVYSSGRYSQTFFNQCKACLGKQHLSYSRNPPYIAVRLMFTTFIALMLRTIFWDLGSKRKKSLDIFNAMGSMYAAVLFLGVQNASSVQPVVAIERTVFYRERAAGMYSALPYSFGQVAVELLPHILIQTLIYGVIVYAMVGFEWTVLKFFWYILFTYLTLLYFTLYGMITVAVKVDFPSTCMLMYNLM